ncbi:MAG: GTP-binding protein [Thermoproteota archaeon]
MNRVRMVAIGGFLGSGKTTTIIKLAKKLASEGRRVAIVTNDEGENLVDTNLVKDYGFAVMEVVGGCFCCRFPDFISHVQDMMREVNPDVILAEPVGSCTDFLATVYGPLRQYYEDKLTLAPFTVLIDAANVLLDLEGKRVLTSSDTAVGDLYAWQVKDADKLAINKTDLVPKEKVPEIEAFLKKLNPTAGIIQISAKTGYNMDELLRILMQEEHKPRPTITNEVNYNTYASAEAELGWFNGIFKFNSDKPLKIDSLMKELLTELNRQVEESKGVIVHAKVRFSTEKGQAKASLVISDQFIDITGEVPPPSKEMDVILNVRAALDPVALTNIVRSSLSAVASKYNASYADWSATSFRPPYPKPYYRLVHT